MTARLTYSESDGLSAEAYAGKIFTAVLGCMETFSLYLGDRLGWFTELAAGPLTPERPGSPQPAVVRTPAGPGPGRGGSGPCGARHRWRSHRRRRLRRRLVDDRAGQGLSVRDGGRVRRGRAIDRGGSGECRRRRCG